MDGDRHVVALCDEDLIGKVFKEGKLKLEVSARFYKGEKKSEEEIAKVLEGENNINIVGKESVEFAIKCGIISKEDVIKIKGIPHVICVKDG